MSGRFHFTWRAAAPVTERASRLPGAAPAPRRAARWTAEPSGPEEEWPLRLRRRQLTHPDQPVTSAQPTGESSAGEPLQPATRRQLEALLGHDFSRVRVHTGEAAERSARRAGTRAFTVGDDIMLATRDTTSQAARQLLAHELAHVIQQRRGGGAPGPAHEAEAAAVAAAAAAGRKPVVALGAARGSAQHENPVSSAPAPPSWLDGVPARHIEGDIWEVQFAVGGPHYVGPYAKLTAFIKRTGLKADAHHIVGGEHLEDLGSTFTYNDAPAVAVDPRLHDKVLTPRIGAEQRMIGGRRGGRPVVSPAEVESIYRAVYSEQAPFRELARIARNIIRQSTPASGPPVPQAQAPARPVTPGGPAAGEPPQVKGTGGAKPAVGTHDEPPAAGETDTGPAAKTPAPTSPQPGRFTGMGIAVGSAAVSLGIGLLSSYLKARVDQKIAAKQIDRNQAKAVRVINDNVDVILKMMMTDPGKTLYARVFMTSAVITTFEANQAPEPTTSDSAPLIDLTGVGFTFQQLDPALADTFAGGSAGGRHMTMTRLLVSEIPLETPPIENLVALAKARRLPLDELRFYVLGRLGGVDQKQEPQKYIAEVNHWKRALDLINAATAGP